MLCRLRPADPGTNAAAGEIVILDNLPRHKSAAARGAIKAAGAHMLFLPPISPDINPIENAFSKLKGILRKAAARTVPDLWDGTRSAMLCRPSPQTTAPTTSLPLARNRSDQILL